MTGRPPTPGSEPRPGGQDAAVAVAPPDARDPEPDLLELLTVLGRSRRLLATWVVGAALVSAAISLVIPKTFTAITRILPPQQAQSSAVAMLSQLGVAGGFAGSALGLKNPSDLYVGILKSDTVADALIARFKLKDAYREDLLVDARKTLAEASRFTTSKSGLIEIEVDARDPALAAEMANAYVEELHKVTSTLAVTEAAQRRVFFERQLRQANERLADAEVKLRQALESGGLVSVDAQSRAAVETVARLRAQISVKGIQIGAMREYASAANPELRRAEQELASMRQELARLESGGASDVTELRTESAPREGRSAKENAVGLGNIRLLREVKYNEVMFELLARQYEVARLDESKESPIVQVMDRALPPERKSKPRRAVIVILSTFAALLGSVLFALLRHSLEQAETDPRQRGRLHQLRAAWSRVKG